MPGLSGWLYGWNGYNAVRVTILKEAVPHQEWIMVDELFNVIFRGDVLPGHNLLDVKVRFGQLFKMDAAKVDTFFTGKPMVLKPNCDRATGDKFKAVLEQAGALVDVRSANPQAAVPAPAPSAPVSSAPAPVPVASQPASAPSTNPWSLSPGGSNLIRPDEVVQPEPVKVDISQISLVKRNPFSADAEEPLEADRSVPPPKLDLSRLNMAAVGEQLVPFEEFVSREIDLSELSLDAPGADVLREDEREVVVPVRVDTSGIDIAPPGGDLGQIKPPPAPPAPSTEHISFQK
jgi:hypothetical protein